MAARSRRTQLNDGWREKIQASMLINQLAKHAFGKVEMTPTQVRAAEILLKKVAPDLQSVESTVDTIERLEVVWGDNAKGSNTLPAKTAAG